MPKKIIDIKTAKGRWEACKGQMQFADKADEIKQMLIFYAGFAACLEFNMDIAELDDGQAIFALQQAQVEVDTIAAVAHRTLGDGRVS